MRLQQSRLNDDPSRKCYAANLLAELSREICGYDFSHESQVSFLSHTSSCDVQAVPGNGKTTLLVAKLALLSRNWNSRTQGVCVISHTNAARVEIEGKLLGHPRASAFLNYPHFIGTVTAFVNQYLALPYLRGLGWTVHHIDDDAFAAEALRRMKANGRLVGRTKMQNGALKHQVEDWVSRLDLAPDFEYEPDQPLLKLKVFKRKGQHGPQTDCGRELEEFKANLVGSGHFRFADMTALATKSSRYLADFGSKAASALPACLAGRSARHERLAAEPPSAPLRR